MAPMLPRSNRAAMMVSLSLALGAALAACGAEPTSSDPPTSQSTSGQGTSSTSGGDGGSTSASTTTTGNGSTSTGTTTSTTATGMMGCQGLGDPCTDCSAQQCHDLYCGCYDDAVCGALVACAQGCAPNDTACSQACLTANESAISKAALLSDCAAISCSGLCPGATQLVPCEKCAAQSCEAQLNACVANPECTALVECVLACPQGDDFCAGGCYFDHSDGQDDATALQDCTSNACPGQCG